MLIYLLYSLITLTITFSFDSRFQSFRLKLHYNVPYAPIASFCLQPPSHSLAFSQANVLIDTGSSEFWLADDQCAMCPFTRSFCPHVHGSEMAVGYYSGSVHGSYSFLKVCERRVKFLCVRGAMQMGNMGGEGILGVKKSEGHSVGYEFLFEGSPDIEEVSPHSSMQTHYYLFRTMTLYYGEYERLMYLGKWIGQLSDFIQHFSHGMKELTQERRDPEITHLECDPGWELLVSQISVFGLQTIDMSLQVSIDSGSSDIVFPSGICVKIIQLLHEIIDSKCEYYGDARTGAGLYCSEPLPYNLSHIGFREKSGKTFIILNEEIIDRDLNKIDLICQPPSNDAGKIILGYPFLKSYEVSFLAATSEHTTSYNAIVLQAYEDSRKGREKMNLYAAFLCYLCTIGSLSCFFLSVLTFLQNKRSKKIII